MAELTSYIAPNKNSIGSIVASWTDLTLETADYNTVTDETSGNQTVTTAELGLKRYWPDWDGEPNLWVDSSAGTLSSNLSKWVIQGCQDIVQMIESTSPQDLDLFTVGKKMGLTNGFYTETGAIKSVTVKDSEGKEYPASKGEFSKSHLYSDLDSIYYAELTNPVWVRHDNRIWVYPFDSNENTHIVYTFDYPRHGAYWTGPDGAVPWTEEQYNSGGFYYPNDDEGGPGYGIPSLHEVEYRELSAVDHYIVMLDGTTSLDVINEGVDAPSPTYEHRIPEKYNVAIALFVAQELMKYRMRTMYKQIPTVADYSGVVSESDSTALSAPEESSDGWEKVRWYVEIDEDPELAQIKMAELNGEQQQFVQRYQWYAAQYKDFATRYQQFFNIETQKKDTK